MSLTTDLVAFFLRQEPGAEFTAGDIYARGSYPSSTGVYAQLAVMAQPGGPFMRERKSGIYHYRVRPGFDLSEYHKTIRGAYKPPAAPQPAAAQAHCRTPASSPGPSATTDSANGGIPGSNTGSDASPDKSQPAAQPALLAAPEIKPVQPPVVLTPKAEPAKPAPEIRKPFLPPDEPNPVRSEVLRTIHDLRMRGEAIAEMINLLEIRFQVKA